MFDDENWVKKILLGVVIALVPILNFAWLGYCLDILRNTAKGISTLPEWDDIGNKLIDGFKLFAARLIYAVPAMILTVGPACLFILPALLTRSHEKIAGVMMVFAALILLVAILLVSLYTLAFGLISPAMTIHYTRTNSFGAFFEFKKIFAILKKDFGTYVVVILVVIAMSYVVNMAIMLLNFIVGWVPCIGWLIFMVTTAVAAVWLECVIFHLYGQMSAKFVTE
jgi:hypothetical protein